MMTARFHPTCAKPALRLCWKQSDLRGRSTCPCMVLCGPSPFSVVRWVPPDGTFLLILLSIPSPALEWSAHVHAAHGPLITGGAISGSYRRPRCSRRPPPVARKRPTATTRPTARNSTNITSPSPTTSRSPTPARRRSPVSHAPLMSLPYHGYGSKFAKEEKGVTTTAATATTAAPSRSRAPSRRRA